MYRNNEMAQICLYPDSISILNERILLNFVTIAFYSLPSPYRLGSFVFTKLFKK